MGFYIRKSFRKGPVRLNLSKSGLGFSTGVKGARLGAGPKGAYVHAGREGLYYRKMLGSKKRKAPVGSDSFWKLIGLIIVIVLIFLIAQWFIQNPVIFFFLVAAVAVVGGAIFYSTYKRKRALKNYKSHLDNCFILNSKPLDEIHVKKLLSLKSALDKDKRSKSRIEEIEKGVYGALLDKILDDGKVTAEETKYINVLEKIISVDENFKNEAKKELFRSYYLEAIADHKITKQEIQTLKNIITGLNIKKVLIQDELLIVNEIIRMQKLSLPLEPLENVPVKIQKSEVLYYSDKAKVLTRRKAKKGIDTEYEYSVKRDGEFVVTNKRVLVVDEGTTAVKLNDIVDIDVDLDNKMIVLSKSTSSKPVLIQSHESLYAGRIIDLLAQ